MAMNEKTSLADRIRLGGVYKDIDGSSSSEVVRIALEAMPLPTLVDRDVLYSAIMEREALTSTAIGYGIALPHPRNPIISSMQDERVATVFLKHPIEFDALDGKPVFILFFIFSASSKSHLVVLSRLSFLCRTTEFQSFLGTKPSVEALADYVAQKELGWGNS